MKKDATSSFAFENKLLRYNNHLAYPLHKHRDPMTSFPSINRAIDLQYPQRTG